MGERMTDELRPIEWVGDAIRVIDQTALPARLVYDSLRSVDDVVWWPLPASRSFVKEKPDSRGKAEHRQHPTVRKTLAELILNKMRVGDGGVDACDETSGGLCQTKFTPG